MIVESLHRTLMYEWSLGLKEGPPDMEDRASGDDRLHIPSLATISPSRSTVISPERDRARERWYAGKTRLRGV